MAATPRKSSLPVQARTRPALVPDSGMVGSNGPSVLAGGGIEGALAALASKDIDMANGHGGAARGGALIDQPRQAAPIVEGGDEGGGGADVLQMLAGLGKSMGKGGAGADAPPKSADSEGGGLLDKIKGLFLGPKKPDVAAAGGVSAGVTAPDIASRVNIGALEPALPVDAPIPTARPALPGDPPAPPDPRLVQGPAFQPDIGQVSAAAPHVERERTMLDKFRDNPLATALIFGGLGTMSAASRPGATPLGALGVGATGGLRTAFDMDASQRDQERDDRKTALAEDRETSENKLRIKQGTYYDARTDAEPAKAAANTTRAAASAANATAHQKSADASMVRADAYAKRPAGALGGGPSVFQQKQQAWMAVPGHENDLQGALDYAAGHKSMSGADKYLAARRLATSQMNGMIAPPDDPEAFLHSTTSDIMNSMDANDAVRGNGQPGSNKPAPANKPGGPAMGGKGGNPSGALADAKFAIAHGAPRDKVIARLKAKNIDASGL